MSSMPKCPRCKKRSSVADRGDSDRAGAGYYCVYCDTYFVLDADGAPHRDWSVKGQEGVG